MSTCPASSSNRVKNAPPRSAKQGEALTRRSSCLFFPKIGIICRIFLIYFYFSPEPVSLRNSTANKLTSHFPPHGATKTFSPLTRRVRAMLLHAYVSRAIMQVSLLSYVIELQGASIGRKRPIYKERKHLVSLEISSPLFFPRSFIRG